MPARIFTGFLIAIMVAMLFCAGGQKQVNAQGDSTFSIIWITDTQYLSESYPNYFSALCNWIVENKDTYNVKMVVHTGDLVDSEGNQTQWESANEAMSILLNNDVPYCWNAGNHDYNETCWIGNQYTAFNTSLLQEKSYWVSDESNGLNTAVHFNISGWDCLIINMAYNASESALAWASNLLDSNPDSHVIVGMHAYIDRVCKYNSWATNLKDTVLDTHSNVFMTISGHYYPTDGNRTRVGGRDELLFNMQDKYGGLGAASARILTFDTAKGTITVQTYIRYANVFLSDSNNNFTLTSTFRNDPVQTEDMNLLTAVVIVSIVLLVPVSVFMVIRYKRTKSRVS